MKPNTKPGTSAPQHRNALGQWIKGVSGAPPALQFKPGNKWRIPPGQTGNPSGVSKLRAAFELEFYQCLLGQGDPNEAAALLWKAARAGEAWGVQMLLDRIAPKDSKLKLEISKGQDEALDYSKLSDEQIQQLEAILENAGIQPREIESGDGPAEPV